MNDSSKARLVILGPPGAGKGTQGKLVSEALGIRHIASGDLVRQHQADETPLGVASQTYYSMGLLVPDVITFQIVLPVVLNASNGFLLDGFPRNIHQAERLDRELQSKYLEIDHALLITVPPEEIMLRLSSRMVCPDCKRVYHTQSAPPIQENICDFCQQRLIQRKDDTLEAIKVRMEEYHAQTLPLARYYRGQNKLMEVSGLGSAQDVLHRILSSLHEFQPADSFANGPSPKQPNPGLTFKKHHV